MKNVILFNDIPQNSEEWMELRKGKATGSSFSLIMAHNGKSFGDPAKQYALSLAIQICTGLLPERLFSNSHMERGHKQESLARMLYEDIFFIDVANGGFFDCGRYGSSPDGLIGENGILEIKSVISSTHFDTLKRNSFDPAYKWQLLGHLLCTGREYCDFVSYCSDFTENKQLLIHRLYAEDYQKEINELKTRLADFIDLIDEIIEIIK